MGLAGSNLHALHKHLLITFGNTCNFRHLETVFGATRICVGNIPTSSVRFSDSQKATPPRDPNATGAKCHRALAAKALMEVRRANVATCAGGSVDSGQKALECPRYRQRKGFRGPVERGRSRHENPRVRSSRVSTRPCAAGRSQAIGPRTGAACRTLSYYSA